MPAADDQKQQVQDAVDIAEVVGDDVALKAKGREFVALCPFHDDNNPSMYVVPAKQIYHCFVCGAGGDVFSWLINHHKMSFPEALEYLAGRAGIQLRRTRGLAGEGERSERERVAEANAKALAFFRNRLRDREAGAEARRYLAERGITDEMAEAFQIGYAPDRWEGLAKAGRDGPDAADAERAGLLAKNKWGGHYDRLRHRIVFPILDALGRPIAFGGRRMREGDEPKYWNTPETPLFDKSAALYGIHRAKKRIIQAKRAVIVEGYTDVIAAHQAGAENVVATLGTALTAKHARVLRRYAEQVVLIFDADEAGSRAAERAAGLFLGEELDVAIATLPGGLDPADLLAQEDGLERWNRALAEARDALDYLLDRVRDEMAEQDTVTGRQRAAERFLQRLGELGFHNLTPVRRAMVLQRLAELLHMREAEVEAALSRYGSGGRGGRKPEGGNEGAASATPAKRKALERAERQVIGALLRDPELFHRPLADGLALDEALTPAELVTPDPGRAYQRLYDRLAEDRPVSLAGFCRELAEAGEEELARLATAAEGEIERLAGDDRDRLAAILREAVACLRRHHRERAYDEQRREVLSGEGDPERLRDLQSHLRANPSKTRIMRRSRN